MIAASLPDLPDAATNPGGNELDCAALAPVQVGLPAHSAPLGLTFLAGSKIPAPWSDGALYVSDDTAGAIYRLAPAG